MIEVDRYVAELASSLHLGGRDRSRILSEVRDHLDDAIADRQQAGDRRELAVAQALNAFGAPSLLATQLNAEAGTRAMRRAPVIALVAGLAVFAGFLLAGTTQSGPAAPTNAAFATQVSFFAAVLAFQVAVVAGICAASRALALWRSPVAHGDDRQLVHRCATLSTAALGVAAAAWSITMMLALNGLADPNILTLVLGGAVMLGAAAAAIVSMSRLRVNPFDDVDDAEAGTSGLFGLGERSIGFVRRHPVLSCAMVAAFSVVPAMSHAETTLSGALPWGLVQAATVVLGFVILGPRLGLRPRVPPPRKAVTNS